MRHGEAESRFDLDASRPLTVRGRREVAKVITAARANISPVIIVASPYRRAQQTARLVADSLDLLVPVQSWDELLPSGAAETVLHRMAQLDAEELLVVTHQPFISNFIYYLTGLEQSMGTASIAAILLQELQEGTGEVLWLEHKC